MNELQDMLRVQARLHRKQGANALGDLFENALNEIELLKKTYNQLFDAVQGEREQLAKANERAEMCEKIFSEAPEMSFDDVRRMFGEELNKFALEQQIKALEWFDENNLMEDETTTLLLERIEQLRKEQEQ